MSELQHIGGGSPFDKGRIPCSRGGEDRWSARRLMGEMAYSRWEDFEKVVERAKQAARNEGFNVNILFQVFRSTPKNTGGRPQADYHMTRYAAYLTAMSGDSRKPECAAAMHYFAVKTREAELSQPVEMTEDQIVHRALHILDDKVKALAVENRTLVAAIERDAPLVAKAEAHTGSDSDVHRQEFAREVQVWGRKTYGIEIKHSQVMRFLGHIGLFIRGERTDTGHATADAIKRGLAFTDKGTARNGHAWATGKLTARGQDYAWKRITKYVADHRTLELPRELRSGESA
ncbi:phage antirepressor KilAC domain-containing protein [Mycobacteroides salmoniphilum]|uniref:phage antirepressor KilAC domain-containing protein n=1 Tax=Mycobacteroides salmoniphilum TaxID=404941 RepID=UPI00356628EF